MALERIRISSFPEVVDPAEWIVVGDVDGISYKISQDNFKAWLGTVQSIAPREISPTDPEPGLSGVYIPTEDGDYPLIGLDVDRSEGGPDYGMYVQFINDNGAWSKVNTPLPAAQNKIQEWVAQVYSTSDQVVYDGLVYVATENTLPESIPGVSDRWELLFNYLKRRMAYGLINAPANAINFDIENGNIEINGIGSVHLNDDRWVFNTPQTLAFPDPASGYNTIIFNPDTLDFYLRASADTTTVPVSHILCGVFLFTKGNGRLYVNGLNSYSFNGQPAPRKINKWVAANYEPYSTVLDESTGIEYYAPTGAVPDSIPGTSPRWIPLLPKLRKAELILSPKGFNIKIDTQEIEITGTGVVAIEDKRYIYNQPQTLSFSTGYYVICFDTNTLNFVIRDTSALSSSLITEVVVAGFVFLPNSDFNITGISDYSVNGQPKYSKLHEWQAIDYPPGAEVYHLGKMWYSNDIAYDNSIPGTSPRWSEKFPTMGYLTGAANMINFDLVNRKVVVSGLMAVVVNNNRYLVDNGEYDFPPQTGGYYALMFNRENGELRTAVISSMAGFGTEYILIGTFFHHANGTFNATGISGYYVNGEPVNPTGDEIPVILDGELPYYNSTTTASMSENDTVVLDDMDLDDFYQYYDDLVTNYPDYVSKVQFGTQEDGDGGALPLYYYRFKPSNLIKNSPVEDKTIKVFIEAALHGGEKTAAMATYLFLLDVCDNWKNDVCLETFRWNFEFVVVAVAGPYQWIQNTLGLSAGRKNANGVDPNRNFETGWAGGSDDPNSTSYRGPAPFSEIETQAIRDLAIAEYKDGAIALGFHTFTNSPDDPKDITWVIAPEPLNGAAQAFARKAARVYKEKETTSLGDDVPVARINSSQSGGMSYKYYNTIGYNSYLMEINENFQIVPGYEKNDNLALKYGTESFGNMLRMAVKATLI